MKNDKYVTFEEATKRSKEILENAEKERHEFYQKECDEDRSLKEIDDIELENKKMISFKNVCEFEITVQEESRHTELVQWAEKNCYMSDNWHSFLLSDKSLRKSCPPEVQKEVFKYRNVDYWMICLIFEG